MLHSYAMLTRVLTVMTPVARGLPTNITGKPEEEHPHSIYIYSYWTLEVYLYLN